MHWYSEFKSQAKIYRSCIRALATNHMRSTQNLLYFNIVGQTSIVSRLHLAMATPRACLAQWARGSLSASFRPHHQCLNRPAAFVQQSRSAVLAGGTSANAAKYKRNKIQAQAAKKKKGRSHFVVHDLRQAEQYSLCDAMR
jgi:hypothetical protein